MAAGVLPAPVPAAAPAPGHGRRTDGLGAGEAGEAGGPLAPPARPLPAGTVVFGTRGGTEIPLAEVARPGLGLTGPGACAAVRALMIGLLTAAGGGQPEARVVIPAADARQLTAAAGVAAQVPGVSPGLPGGLTVSPSLAAALDLIETEITRRLRLQDTSHATPGSGSPPGGDTALGTLALIATVDPPSVPRVRAVLAAGASTGITGILLGGQAAGTTCRIGADGMVLAATRPGLAGVQASHLSAADAAAMLSLLRGAQGHLTRDEPATPGPPPSGDAGAAAPEPAASPQLGTRGDARGGGEDSAGDGQPSARLLPHPAPLPAPAAAQPAPGRGGAPARSPAAAAHDPAAGAAAGRPVGICVLGPLRITAGGAEITGGLRKARELLAFLAVHPDGVTGEGISAALWPESGPRYAASQRHLALRKAREMLRTATGLPGPMFITRAGERYRLDPALIGTDLQQFDAALSQAQAAAGEEGQLAALQRAAALYHGPLAGGAAWDWAERYAEPGPAPRGGCPGPHRRDPAAPPPRAGPGHPGNRPRP